MLLTAASETIQSVNKITFNISPGVYPISYRKNINYLEVLYTRLTAEGDDMTTAAIDINTLNDLFDNQQKLDDVFDSIFDEDPFLDSSPSNASQNSYAVDNDYAYFNDKVDNQTTTQSTMQLIMPVVLEIAVLYYGIAYLL